MKRLLQAVVASLALASVAAAEEALITIEIDNPGSNTEITLYDSGRVFVDLPWPIDNKEFNIPAGLIPEGAEPYDGETITLPYYDEEGERYSDEALGLGAGIVLGAYLIGEWLSGDERLAPSGSVAAVRDGHRPLARPPYQVYPNPYPYPYPIFNPGRDFINAMRDEIIDSVTPYAP